MGMMDFLKKPKAQEPFTETTFECKRGDLTIRGTEYRPEGENLPVAIVSHGFMAWQDTVRQYTKELAQMGYCAYCFDFCGGSVMKKGKSDGATTDMSVLTEVQDLEAVIERAHDNEVDFIMHGGDFCNDYKDSPEMVNRLVNNKYGYKFYGV